jgi:hypothetical protein
LKGPVGGRDGKGRAAVIAVMQGKREQVMERAVDEVELETHAHAVDFRPAALGVEGLVQIFDLELRARREGRADDLRALT